MKIQVHDQNMNQRQENLVSSYKKKTYLRTHPQNVTIKVGSGVKREFEKYLAVNCPAPLTVTRPRTRRLSRLRPQKMPETSKIKSDYSREKILKIINSKILRISRQKAKRWPLSSSNSTKRS